MFLANCESTKYHKKRRDFDKFVEREDKWKFDIWYFVKWFAVHTKVEFSRGGVEGNGALGDNIGNGPGRSGLFVQHIKLVYLWSKRKEIKYP